MLDHYEFDRKNFNAAVGTREFPADSAATDAHVDYLFGYLNNDELDAKMIVVEHDYVDGDFLQDFASYYVSCHTPYERYCKRLHFFSEYVPRAQFEAIIAGEAKPKHVRRLRKTYLGFIVIKPLPDAIIGRTQLKTYGDDHGRRHYDALVDYDVHLFGVSLRVRSLAFQEQDQALAACATVALWSCFQKTSRLFGTPAPRPPKITMDATMSFFDQRALPSSYLYVEQICSAIRQNGLDPEVYGAAACAEAPVASLIYAHVRMGLPVLLIMQVEELGQHAVTISGYSLREQPIHANESPYGNAPPLIGRRIDEFYAHDDQQGPFSRLLFFAPTCDHELPYFEGKWKRDDGTARRLTPTQIVIPVYQKIRLPYLKALDWVNRINLPIQVIARALDYGELEWDAHLTTTNDYKKQIRKARTLARRRLEYLLTEQQPRFFWRFAAMRGNKIVCELLVDATGFTKSFPLMAINFYDERFATRLAAIAPYASDRLSKPYRILIAREFRNRQGPPTKMPAPTAGEGA
ncbi:MAG: hypothetical protein JOZ77_07885 [Candidatus Eremiobacteraeota bacterium]|nr:hypothetical protein [Candidatus Eremiobacteraeota bacterium]